MYEIAPRRRRADAERSVAAILDAAARLLGERPEASVETIAAAAGVTRQTVYAHYPSRDELLKAVVDRLTAEAIAALDAADLDEGPAMDALLRLLDTTWRMFERRPIFLNPDFATMSPQGEDEPDHHQPVVDRLLRLIRRGQRTGEFDRSLSPTWLVTATIALGHSAGTAVGAGHLPAEEALTMLRVSLMRIFIAEHP